MFIPKILKITDWKTRIVQDRTNLLRDIIKSFLIKIPFQNVSAFGCLKLEERKIPNMKEILDSCFNGSGGVCGHTNYFMKILLESIGYETHLVSAVFRRTGIPSSHLACIVKIPYTKPTSNQIGIEEIKYKIYFIDVGCGVVIHEPILIGKLSYHGRAGGLDYKYEITGDGHLRRINLNGDAIVGPKPSNFESPQDYTVDLTPKLNFEHFNDGFNQVFRNYDTIFLHQGFYLFRYLDINESDFHVIWIRGKELIFATRETRTVTIFDDIRQLEPYIHEYFPMISPHQIKLSIINFNQFQNERKKLKKYYFH